MLAWLVMISVVVLVFSAVLSRVTANQVYRYVEKHYSELWQTINTPTTPAQHSPFFSKRGAFILKHEYKKLADPILNKKAFFALISFQLMLGSLIILILSALSYEFLEG
ncbi:MAG: hypothetical protein WAQ53_08840 [Thiofilum sp.]|uniref:hypothetical protein n=1 Tax=Thiofilum sp. TaxID=2212733 RepID=UPI0025CEA4D4|nr:hypothetical protein [Thiofilum sp.]MBK8452789.1 hypothetical protein [Thiofilum sp.]